MAVASVLIQGTSGAENATILTGILTRATRNRLNPNWAHLMIIGILKDGRPYQAALPLLFSDGGVNLSDIATGDPILGT